MATFSPFFFAIDISAFTFYWHTCLNVLSSCSCVQFCVKDSKCLPRYNPVGLSQGIASPRGPCHVCTKSPEPWETLVMCIHQYKY